VAVLWVPKDRTQYPPSLGYGLIDWIEKNLVFGPGSLQGEPAKFDKESAQLLVHAYEIYPQFVADSKVEPHPYAGMRRFDRVAWELRKGKAKTERAAWVTACELSKDAGVRFDHWEDGFPVGRPVAAPFIPMMAAGEEQVQELAYGVLKWILEHSPNINWQFDIGLDRIVRLGDDGTNDGMAMAVSNAPATRDGARTTFEHFDEPHRLHLPLQRQAHETMIQNLSKRQIEEPWALYTSTAGASGQGSIQEDVRAEAEKIDKGLSPAHKFFFFARWAGEEHSSLDTMDKRIAAIADATGKDVGEWGKGQYARIAADYDREGADHAYWERVWLNRWRQSDAAMFDMTKVKTIAGVEIPKDGFVSVGFDGSRRADSTAMVITDIRTGYQQLVGLWERPEMLNPNTEWEVDVHDVHQTLADVVFRYDMWKLYGDPPYWTEEMASWATLYPDRIVEFWTNQQRRMAYTIRAYLEALDSGACRIVGSQQRVAKMLSHMGSAGKKELNIVDEQGKPLYIMCHAEGRLADKYDAAMAGCLSWAACLEARRKAAEETPKKGMPRRIR
jgi:hypothetical protein